MTSPNYDASAYGRHAVGYSSLETLPYVDEASNFGRRCSRGSGGPRAVGSMRIVKSNGTSSSPRSSMGLSRRRTVMTDARRRIATVDRGVTPEGFGSNDGLHFRTKSNRPLSWHPSSIQQMGSSNCPAPGRNINNEFYIFDLPPTPAPYSRYASPAPAFPPLPLPFSSYDQQQYPYPDAPRQYPSNPNYIYQPQNLGHQVPKYISAPAGSTHAPVYSHSNWSSFPRKVFEKPTAPPTPEKFFPIQHPGPALPTDEAIPYRPLSDTEAEEDGEILRGLGLYDNPEAEKVAPSDPQLDNYRSSMSQLVGTDYRREPAGKGLKLEETWNPPTPDDDYDNNDGNEQDAEGEDEDKTKTWRRPQRIPPRSQHKTTTAVTILAISSPNLIPLLDITTITAGYEMIGANSKFGKDT